MGGTRRDAGVSKASAAEITKEETGVEGPGGDAWDAAVEEGAR